MRSALLATAVLVITALACTSQGESPESATAPPSLENTPRPTHMETPTTPATYPATYPAFQPGERAYVHQFVRDMVADGALKLGDPAPTEAEYRDTCVLLRKHDWELVDSFMDPDATLQTFGIAGSLVVGFTKLTLMREERGYGEYSRADFCENVTGTPHPTIPSTSPPTAPPTPDKTPRPTHAPAPTTPAIYPTFQPGERESVHQFVRDMVADAELKFRDPAPTDAEYKATCTLLRKHDWDSVETFTDPDATLQTVGIAGSLALWSSRLTLIQEERGYPKYSLTHFCEDVTGTPHPTPPATLPATAPPSLENTPRPTHTPAPTTPAIYPTFQPGQRTYVHKTAKEMVSDVSAVVGKPAPTEADYRATCTLLRTNDWDLADSLADPDVTLRSSGIAGALVAAFKRLTRIQEERGYAEYSLAHFCEDVTDTPHSNFPPFSPPPGNTSGPTHTPAPTTPAMFPTFQPGQREYLYKGVKDIVSDTVAELGQPAATEAEYRATCTLLRKHDWELADFFSDPDATVQTSGMAGALVGGFKQLTRVREEHGLTVYSLAHFCEDVLEE